MLNNYFTLFKITQEINDLLSGSNLEYIASDSRHTLFIQFPEHSVLVHLGSGKNYIFVQNKFKKLPVPHFKRFQALNSKIFHQCRVFYQERIIEFCFENDLKLRLFLFQPQSNAVLLEGNSVKDIYFQQKWAKFESLYVSHFDAPAMPYPGAICKALESNSTDLIQNEFPSLSKSLIKDEWMNRLQNSSGTCDQTLQHFFMELQSEHTSLLFSEEKLKKYHYCLPYIPTIIPENYQIEIFESASRAIQTYVSRNRYVNDLLSLREALEKTLKQELKYLRNSIQRLKVQLRKSQDKEKYRKIANLIMWNIHTIPEGARSAEVIDYEDPNLSKVTIQLNPSISPKAYADELFARVKRLEDVSGIEERIRILEQKSDIIQQYLAEISEVTDLKQLKKWPEKLQELGIEIELNKKKKDHQAERVPYREYFLDGYVIRVGKSARESDELTLKISKKHDWFFHTQDIKGSHVIVSHPEKKKLEHLPPHIIEAAAITAAHFSDAKHSSYVPVQYTQVRYIRKPRKSPAGFVTFHQYQTVFVEPHQFEQLPLKTKKDLMP